MSSLGRWRLVAAVIVALVALLSAADRRAVERDVEATRAEVVLVVARGLHGHGLEGYTDALAQRWRVGGADGDGVFVLLAMRERKIRIWTSFTARGWLPDADAARIVDQMRAPLQAGDVGRALRIAAGGVRTAADAPRGWSRPFVRRHGWHLVGALVLLVLVLRWRVGLSDLRYMQRQLRAGSAGDLPARYRRSLDAAETLDLLMAAELPGHETHALVVGELRARLERAERALARSEGLRATLFPRIARQGLYEAGLDTYTFVGGVRGELDELAAQLARELPAVNGPTAPSAPRDLAAARALADRLAQTADEAEALWRTARAQQNPARRAGKETAGKETAGNPLLRAEGPSETLERARAALDAVAIAPPDTKSDAGRLLLEVASWQRLHRGAKDAGRLLLEAAWQQLAAFSGRLEAPRALADERRSVQARLDLLGVSPDLEAREGASALLRELDLANEALELGAWVVAEQLLEALVERLAAAEPAPGPAVAEANTGTAASAGYDAGGSSTSYDGASSGSTSYDSSSSGGSLDVFGSGGASGDW